MNTMNNNIIIKIKKTKKKDSYLNVFVCVLPSSSHSCLYLSVMVVPCCLHMASLGSPMNCSVISISMRAPLESLIFSISRTCTQNHV